MIKHPEEPDRAEGEDAAGTTLSPKRQRFVDEYLIDLNATQAAIRAGYSPATAEQQGPRLLGYAQVEAAIRRGSEAMQRRLGLSSDHVARELQRIAMADLRDLFDERGALLPPKQWPANVAAAVSSLEVVTAMRGEGEVQHVAKLRLWPKTAALEALAKRVWPERRGRPVSFVLPKLETTADAVKAAGAIAEAVSTGALTPEEGAAVAGIVETYRRTIETEQLEQRLAALEGAVQGA